MSWVRTLMLVAASAVAIGGGGHLSAQVGVTPPAWTHSRSDLPADPAIRFGVLPNGMRYALRRSAAPGEIALRLRIDAGSLMERDDQRGLAHFLEHLTLRGTTNLPGDMLSRGLEREGVDIRATTGFNETTYRLDLPRGEPSLDVGLQSLREIVSEATLAPEVIDQERGVVLGEQRSNDTSYVRAETARLGLVVPRLGSRMPIGDMAVIRAASRERIAEFYHSYYRPSRATLVVVGDIDLDGLEAQVRRRFADWRPKGPAGPDAPSGSVVRRGPRASIDVVAGAEPSLRLMWTRPPDRAPDSRAKRRRALARSLGLAVLDERLGRIGRSDAAPFEGVGASHGSEWGAAETTSLSASYQPGRLDAALAALGQAPLQLLRYGITDGELRRQIALARTRRETEARGGARSSAAHAERIIRAIGEGDVPMAAEAELALFDEAVSGLTAAEVTRAARPLFTDADPLVMIVSPTPIPGGEPAILARLESARPRPVPPPSLPTEVAWPYTDFGRPGLVANRREIAGIGATMVTFANGTTLAVKPTGLADGEILVTVSAGLGERGMSADRLDPLYGAGAYLTAGGLGKLSSEQLREVLTGHVVTYLGSVRSDRFQWLGSTRPQDLMLQMQLLAAFVTDPGLRPGPLERLKARYAASSAGLASTPGEALERRMRELMAGGDKRRARPTAEEVRGLDMAVAGPRLREAIGRGPLRVVMVGDLTVDQAIAATASTFGALPPRKPAPASSAKPVGHQRLPGGGGIVQLRHAGPAGQALAFVSWPGPDRVDGEGEFRRGRLLGEILGMRVTEAVRDRLGLAYVPTAGFGGSDVDRGTARFEASAETTLDKVGDFHAAIDGIVRELQAGPVTADELGRARTALIQRSRAERRRNGFWLEALERIGSGPGPAGDLEAEIAGYEAATLADMQATARRYLRPDAAWRANVTPSPPDRVNATAPIVR